LTFMTNLLYGAKITDMETCYKVFRKEVIKGIKLRASRFDFEPEITAKILKKGYDICEVPISFSGRKFEEGKKITWKDGIKAFYYLLKYRFLDWEVIRVDAVNLELNKIWRRYNFNKVDLTEKL